MKMLSNDSTNSLSIGTIVKDLSFKVQTDFYVLGRNDTIWLNGRT